MHRLFKIIQMKRYPDLDREILLAVEADADGISRVVFSKLEETYSATQVGYQVGLLGQSGFLEVQKGCTPNDWLAIHMTAAGHEYLDTIRDSEVWRRTKEGADSIGSWSIETLSTLGRGFIRTQVKRLTGENIDV